VHGAVRVHDVERLHPLLLTEPRKQLRRTRILQSERTVLPAVELEDPGEDELADAAIGVVQDPGPLSRAVA
jgi:hypothetical protein